MTSIFVTHTPVTEPTCDDGAPRASSGASVGAGIAGAGGAAVALVVCLGDWRRPSDPGAALSCTGSCTGLKNI